MKAISRSRVSYLDRGSRSVDEERDAVVRLDDVRPVSSMTQSESQVHWQGPQSDATPRAHVAESDGLARLRDRKLCQWMLAYAAFACLTLQLVDTLSTIWRWSLGLQQVLSLVLGLGALPALVVAWYHGERGRQVVSPIETAILTALVLMEGFIIWTFVGRNGAL